MCGVHAIGDNRDILTMKILTEQRGGALRDGSERNSRVRIDATLQSSKKSVVGAPMESPKKTGLSRTEILLVRKLLEAIEKGVNDDDIGVQTVNSR